MAWTSEDLSELSFSSSTIGQADPTVSGSVPVQPVTSAGMSARVNVLGAIVLEAFYARTFQRTKTWDFGVLLRPGW